MIDGFPLKLQPGGQQPRHLDPHRFPQRGGEGLGFHRFNEPAQALLEGAIGTPIGKPGKPLGLRHQRLPVEFPGPADIAGHAPQTPSRSKCQSPVSSISDRPSLS